MSRNSRVRKSSHLCVGEIFRVMFDSTVGSAVHGGYKLYKVIPSGSLLPALNETWDVEVLTTWENTENRTRYPYTVVVRPVSKVMLA